MSDRMHKFVRDLEALGLGWLAEHIRFFIIRESGEQDGGKHYAETERVVLDRIVAAMAAGEKAPNPMAVIRDPGEAFVWASAAVVLLMRRQRGI